MIVIVYVTQPNTQKQRFKYKPSFLINCLHLTLYEIQKNVCTHSKITYGAPVYHLAPPQSQRHLEMRCFRAISCKEKFRFRTAVPELVQR